MPDAVVIGSGPNGLAAAIRLAEAGREVVVCEAQPSPGGAVRSAELTLPGFVHDLFSAVYPAAVASPVFARMPLADHGLEWVHPAACVASPGYGGGAIVLHRSVEKTAAALGADGDAWRRFVGPLLAGFDGVRGTMLGAFPPLAHPAGLARLAPVLPRSSVALAQGLFRSGLARAWLHGSARHGDARLDRPGSAIAGAWLHLLGHAVGWPSPRGGAGCLTDALVSYLLACGGELRVDAPVTAVEARGGRVTGVVAGGERIAVPIVIADVMPHALAALTPLPGWYAFLLRRYRYGPPTLKVDWALDGPIPWVGPDVGRAGTVHLGDPVAGPFALVGQQSVADPTRAPEGQHTAWAYTHDLQDADALEALVERDAPGFRARILARHVLTPADLEAADANLVGGDVGGGSYILRQAAFRPVPKLSPYTTPLHGLYLGSAATYPGGAVHGVSGDAAARAALRSGA